ncbi:TetR/AcrR family transcriptional regulator [Rothia nasimurium]|uniref:TetR/AcrR family transcriptional regulator n=1 Tax=Rothia nasimurium TaxID=85336 RepID=UPI003B9E59A1
MVQLQMESVIYAHQTPVAAAATRRPGRTNKTQLKLFEAAMDIMSEGGPLATTVEDIAERAGVSKGTVYYNFGSKKTMIDQLLQYGAKLLLAEMSVASQDDDPRLAVHGALRAAIRYIRSHPGFARLWVSELWQGIEDWSATTAQIRTDIILFLRELIVRLSDKYSVRSECKPEDLAIIIFGAVFMLSMDETRSGPHRSDSEAADIAMLTIDGYIIAEA